MGINITISIIIGVVLGLLLFYLFNKLSGPRIKQAPFPAFSEKDAEKLLRKAGFQIMNKKERKTVMTVIDGKEHIGYVEADYIVKKKKRTYIVVVHSGVGEVDPNEPNYRRHLLEHDRVFKPDALLVADLTKGRLHTVQFRFPHEYSLDFFFRFLIAVFIVGLIIGIIWVLATLKLI